MRAWLAALCLAALCLAALCLAATGLAAPGPAAVGVPLVATASDAPRTWQVRAVRSLTVTGSWLWGADVGHELKSRAATNTIVANRFDEADATAS